MEGTARIWFTPQRPARRRLTTGQNGGNRCEEIASMAAAGEALRLLVDVPTARSCGAALDQFEQTVAGADVPATIGFENNGRPRPADAPIGNPKASAYLLAAYAQWFPVGTVFLCVVDPGISE